MSALLSYVVRKYAAKGWVCGFRKCDEKGVEKLRGLAMGNPRIVRLSENWALSVVACATGFWTLTLQDMCLGSGGLACALQRTAVDKVHNDAVRKLLQVLIRTIRSLELREMVALGDTLWVRYRRSHDKVARSVNLHESPFPKLFIRQQCTEAMTCHQTYQGVGKLNVEIADLDRRRRFPQRRQ